jgi:hypothetical protein
MPSSWVSEIEDILDEAVPIKLEFVRNDILREIGPLGLILHTRLNRMYSNNHNYISQITSLTEEEKEIIESPEALRMDPIPNK